MNLVNADGEKVVLCSELEARALTDRIRSTADELWALLLEAHERRAWSALGYESFVDYAHVEFGMSKSRAYQLLDQGRMIEEIEAAVAESIDLDSTSVETEPVVQITEAEARDIKPSLPEVKAAIQERIEDEQATAPAEVRDIVREEVDRARKPVSIPRSDGTIAFDALNKLSKAAATFVEDATTDRLDDLPEDDWECFQRLSERLSQCTSRIADAGRRRRNLRAISGGKK